jgi:hypothetical protein
MWRKRNILSNGENGGENICGWRYDGMKINSLWRENVFYTEISKKMYEENI